MSPRFTMDDDAASLVSSQDSITGMEFVQRANQMMADTKKRRDAKRNKIENERAQRIKDFKKKLGVLYENRKTQRCKIQKAQWKQLSILNTKRQELERQILDSMAVIEGSTLIMVRELDAVLLGRLNAMKSLANDKPAA
ncbi:d5067f39-44a5-4855-9536-3ac494012002 [Sclerotinia trifoliorum]|uniref:D5067f39-44a5-4855-9536-3ac494012002 n=1 Tax=Sclerotinia trifoliorum TaxID=28548 RepID=A0A8H2ZQN0_9HELO|nr:d5067f39-44a5-4855-9536-3ac494012002 [Sclerotinia trifoliorum]